MVTTHTHWRRRLGIAVVSIGFAAVTTTARADEVTTEEPHEPPAEAAAAPPALGPVFPYLDILDQQANTLKDFGARYGLTLGMGFSASYQYGFTRPASSKLSLRLLDKDHDKFSVDLYQLTVAKQTPNPGDWGFMFQGITGRFSRRYKSDWNGSGVFNDTQWERKELELQQGYLAYNVPVGNGVQLKLGKFNTLVGSEVNEPWLNPNFSKQNIYALLQPATHTGGLASYAFNDKVSLTVGGINGWDVVEDNNGLPSFIGQLALTPVAPETLLLGIIYGPEQPGNHHNMRTLYDVVNILKPIDGLLIQTNFDYLHDEGADIHVPGTAADAWGISNTIAYDIHPRLNAAFRAEWIDDEDGARTGIDQGIWELTLDLKWRLTDYLYMRGEYRHDESNRKPFIHEVAGTVAGQDSLAWEIGYNF